MLAPAEFNSLRTSLLPARTARCTGVKPENSNVYYMYKQTVNVYELDCVGFCTVLITLYRTHCVSKLLSKVSYFFYLGMALALRNFIVVFTSLIFYN